MRDVPPATNYKRTETSSSTQAFNYDPVRFWRQRSRPFVVREVEGKGFGVIATQRILKGTEIISEPPLQTTVLPKKFSKHSVKPKIKNISQAKLRALHSLYNHFPEERRASGLIKTNLLILMCQEKMVLGVFYMGSRFNHACIPNCQQAWNDLRGTLTIHAVRDIELEEELTIPYMNFKTSSATRRARLKRKYGFECKCETCTLPKSELELSDERMIALSVHWTKTGDTKEIKNKPRKYLSALYVIKRIYEAENIFDLRMAEVYHNAFATVIAHGDLQRAREFARRLLVIARTCVGDDGEVTQQARQLRRYPKKDSSYLLASASGKRKSAKKSRSSKTTENSDFDKWLFWVTDC